MRALLIVLSALILFSCTETKQPATPSHPLYQLAYDYVDQEKPDSAFLYFDKAREAYLQAKDSLGAGRCLVQMALLANETGDFFGSQELALSSLAYFDDAPKEQDIYLQSVYNTLGMTSYDLKEYTQAIEFYNQCIKYTPDTATLLIIRNNIANAYRKSGNLSTALKIYADLVRKQKDSVEFARVLSNFAYTKWLQNPVYSAEAELLQALDIRIQQQARRGQNASYAHLADYYASRNPDRARSYAEEMYRVAQRIDSPDDQLEALQKLVKLSQPAQSRSYFERYQQLEDSIQTARNAARNQFALIRYQTEKHKADSARKQNDILKRNIALAILASILLAGYFWYRKRQKQLQQEKQLEIKNTELKYSKKIHDGVANDIYRVMNEIEHGNTIDREELLGRLERTYNRSRNISYEIIQSETQRDYSEMLSELLRSFGRDTTKILIIGNSAEVWQRVSAMTRNEVEHVMQELMVNMSKHSQATQVVIRFEKEDNNISIHYTDNGIGFDQEHAPKNGLTNTVSRIEHIGGTVSFETNAGKGLKIHLQFPES